MSHPILQILTNLTPLILGVAAFTAGSWFVDGILRQSDQPGVDIESFARTIIKIVQFFGMAMGILCFAVLVSVLLSGLNIYNDPLTLILLGLLGFVLLIAPITKVPWAAILGLIIGVAAAAILAYFAPDWLIALLPFPFKYLVIIVFIIVGLLVFISFKWIQDFLRAFAFILASRPVTLILLALGLAQAIALLYYSGGLLTILPF